MDEQNILERLFNRQLVSANWKWTIRIVMIVVWCLLIVILTWTTWKSRFQIASLLSGADYSKIGIIFVLYIINLFMSILGWQTIIRSFNFSPSYWRNLQIFCATFGLRRLPGTVWYVGGRMLLYQRLGMSKLSILQASAIELVITFISGGIVCLGSFIYLKISLPSVLIISILISLALGLIILYPNALRRRFINYESQIFRNFSFLDSIISIITYSIVWVTGGIMVGQIVNVVQPVNLFQNIYIVGSWSISGLAGFLTIFLPTTFGATELTLTAFLSRILPLPLAGAVAISARLLTFSMEVLLSIVFYPISSKFLPNKDTISD